MTAALVVITDGRGDYLEQTLESAEERLIGEFSPAIIIDDSGDPEYASWLEGHYPGFWQFHHDRRSGFGAVVRTAWQRALEHPDVTHIFHLEEDFTFNEPIDVVAMAEVLDVSQSLAQIVLKRQPWSSDEITHGGQIEYCEARGDIFEEHTCSEVTDEGEHLIGTVSQHRINFSTNPSLMTRLAAELCLDTGESCTEGLVTKVCLDAGLSFAYWGAKSDPPKCHHIGDHRSEGWSE